MEKGRLLGRPFLFVRRCGWPVGWRAPALVRSRPFARAVPGAFPGVVLKTVSGCSVLSLPKASPLPHPGRRVPPAGRYRIRVPVSTPRRKFSASGYPACRRWRRSHRLPLPLRLSASSMTLPPLTSRYDSGGSLRRDMVIRPLVRNARRRRRTSRRCRFRAAWCGTVPFRARCGGIRASPAGGRGRASPSRP